MLKNASWALKKNVYSDVVGWSVAAIYTFVLLVYTVVHIFSFLVDLVLLFYPLLKGWY